MGVLPAVVQPQAVSDVVDGGRCVLSLAKEDFPKRVKNARLLASIIKNDEWRVLGQYPSTAICYPLSIHSDHFSARSVQ